MTSRTPRPRGLLGSRRRRGSAALEFGLLLPLLATLAMATTDWGLAIEQRIRLQTAARAGAEVAIVRPSDTAGITAAVREAAPDLTSMSVAASAVWCECNGTAIDCSASCFGGLARFMSITATHPYSRISPLGPTSVAGRVTLRLQ